MKKKITIFSIMLIVVFVCCMFVACGQKDARQKHVGLYVFESITVNLFGSNVTYNVGDTYFFIPLHEDFMTIDLKEDGTYIATTALAEESATGTWEVKEDEIWLYLTLNEDGEESEMGDINTDNEDAGPTILKIDGDHLIETTTNDEDESTVVVFVKKSK